MCGLEGLHYPGTWAMQALWLYMLPTVSITIKWFQGISGEHICIFLVFVVCFETGSQNVAQAGGILVAILLPWFIECWNYRHALSNLVSNFVLFGFGFDFLNHNSSCSSRSPRKAM